MARIKANGAKPETLQDKVAILAARQSAFRDEVQRAQTSEAILRHRLGGALASALAEKAKADLRAIDAIWARYIESMKGQGRPDRRNRIRRVLEQILVRMGSLGQRLLVRWTGLTSRSGETPLFDAAWYLRRYPDVSSSGLEPLAHYLVFGGGEGRAPHPLFDVAHYTSQASDLGATGLTPLVHYARIGLARGLSPHPLFDVKYYVAQAPEVLATRECPLQHYLRVGAAMDLAPSRLFQPAYYRRQLAADDHVPNPLLHYVQRGHARGLQPHPLFDPAWFRATYPQVGEAEPLGFFTRHGAEGRLSPGPWFDTSAYLQQRGEARLTRLDPLSDYLAGGAWLVFSAPGPAMARETAPSVFAAAFPEAAAQGLTPLEFWAAHAQRGEETLDGLRPQAG